MLVCGGCNNLVDIWSAGGDSGGECPDRVPVDEAHSADVAAMAKSFSGDYMGTLTWNRTGATSPLAVSVARLEREPITQNQDCSGNLQGYTIPMKVSVSSGDMLVMPNDNAITLRVDSSGAFESMDSSGFEGDVDFETLKAAGITPPEWGKGFYPKIHIPFGDGNLTPLDGTVSAPEGYGGKEVVLGSVTFP
jgi:hypothetical protein